MLPEGHEGSMNDGLPRLAERTAHRVQGLVRMAHFVRACQTRTIRQAPRSADLPDHCPRPRRRPASQMRRRHCGRKQPIQRRTATPATPGTDCRTTGFGEIVNGAAQAREPAPVGGTTRMAPSRASQGAFQGFLTRYLADVVEYTVKDAFLRRNGLQRRFAPWRAGFEFSSKLLQPSWAVASERCVQSMAVFPMPSFDRSSKARSCHLDGTAIRQLRRRPRKRNLASRMRQINPTGKSLLIYGNRVKPRNKKYFAFTRRQIRGIYLAIPSCSEGRRPSSRTLGGLRWTLTLRLTSAAEAYGKDVWS